MIIAEVMVVPDTQGIKTAQIMAIMGMTIYSGPEMIMAIIHTKKMAGTPENLRPINTLEEITRQIMTI